MVRTSETVLSGIGHQFLLFGVILLRYDDINILTVLPPPINDININVCVSEKV